MRLSYVTCFDSVYAAVGITMLESLLVHCPNAEITVLDLDGRTGRLLSANFGTRITLLQLSDLFDVEPRLLGTRERRSPWEFYSTLRPILLSVVLARLSADEALCYVDADMYFFGSPASIFIDAADAAVALSPHRFSWATQHLDVHGVFNAGLLLVRNGAIGQEALRRWSEQCLEWCYSLVPGDGRFMNQGYLTKLPSLSEKISVMLHPGVNLAPWNVGAHRISYERGAVCIDGYVLVCFHFSSLWRDDSGNWQTFYLDRAMHQELVLKSIYAPYILAIEKTSQKLKQIWGVDGIAQSRNRPASDGLLTVSKKTAVVTH